MCLCEGFRMRILFLKGGRSGTQGKEFATLWITTPGPLLSVTLALENPLCKNTLRFFTSSFVSLTWYQKTSVTQCLYIFWPSEWKYKHVHAREPEVTGGNQKDLIFTFFVFLRTKGPQIAYERSFRWKLAHFRYLCQVCVLLLLGVIPFHTHVLTSMRKGAILQTAATERRRLGSFEMVFMNVLQYRLVLVVLLRNNSSFLPCKALCSLCFYWLRSCSLHVNCVVVTGQVVMFHRMCSSVKRSPQPCEDHCLQADVIWRLFPTSKNSARCWFVFIYTFSTSNIGQI